jgi:hypothetical protein
MVLQVDEAGNTICLHEHVKRLSDRARTITANTPCDNADEVRDPVTLVCGKPTGGQTKVCPEGTK